MSGFVYDSAIKFSSQGGSDVVDPDRNLNFWAGELSGGLSIFLYLSLFEPMLHCWVGVHIIAHHGG